MSCRVIGRTVGACSPLAQMSAEAERRGCLDALSGGCV